MHFIYISVLLLGDENTRIEFLKTIKDLGFWISNHTVDVINKESSQAVITFEAWARRDNLEVTIGHPVMTPEEYFTQCLMSIEEGNPDKYWEPKIEIEQRYSFIPIKTKILKYENNKTQNKSFTDNEIGKGIMCSGHEAAKG